jgi:hypothetical protein
MNCEQIIEAFAAYMIDKALGNTDIDLSSHILHHIQACSRCSEQADVMLRMVTGENFRLSRPLSCDEACDRIAEIMEADDRQETFAFPAERLHILGCADCRAVYEMTRATLVSEKREAFEAIRQSALPLAAAKPTRWARISPFVRKLTAEITILASKGQDALGLLPGWLASATLIPIPAGAYRSGRGTSEYIQEIVIPEEEQKWQLVIRTRALEDNYLQLQVKILGIADKGRSSGMSIALLDGRGRYLMQIIYPDAPGDDEFVEFPKCLPGRYTLKISEQQKSWEVSLHLG